MNARDLNTMSGAHARMEVYLDSAPENFVPDLALHAERVLDERWNGWLRPLATADAFGRFLDSWRWGYVTEVGDILVCSVPDSDEPADEFARAGETVDGTSLYYLTGWVWISAEDDDGR